MKYFYADSLDLVDPTFNFGSEEFSPGRVPQRDDVYAHQLFGSERPYDGILVSKWLIDGRGTQGRYTEPQRQRFLREGVQSFLRFPERGVFDPENFPILGDCGAFNYHSADVPPFSVDDVVEFYDACGFTHGISVDHMILGYDERLDVGLIPVPAEYQRRAELTLTLAADFLARARRGRSRFQPIGVAQGWSPKSYAKAVRELVAIGYDYIALGSMVPLKTRDIEAVLRAVAAETAGRVRLHLLGITRLASFEAFARAGVVSLDSTSPLRQGVKEGIYYSSWGDLTTLRIPQTDVFPRLLDRIRSGAISQSEAVRRERSCLASVRSFGAGECAVDELVGELVAYEKLFDGRSKWSDVRRTLELRPWEHCPCAVCRAIGIDVLVFRGAQRNRRRGFHNLWFTHRQLSQLRAEAIQ